MSNKKDKKGIVKKFPFGRKRLGPDSYPIPEPKGNKSITVTMKQDGKKTGVEISYKGSFNIQEAMMLLKAGIGKISQTKIS